MFAKVGIENYYEVRPRRELVLITFSCQPCLPSLTGHISLTKSNGVTHSHGICHNPLTARDSLSLLCEL